MLRSFCKSAQWISKWNNLIEQCSFIIIIIIILPLQEPWSCLARYPCHLNLKEIFVTTMLYILIVWEFLSFGFKVITQKTLKEILIWQSSPKHSGPSRPSYKQLKLVRNPHQKWWHQHDPFDAQEEQWLPQWMKQPEIVSMIKSDLNIYSQKKIFHLKQLGTVHKGRQIITTLVSDIILRTVTGFALAPLLCSARNSAARSSASPPISPIMIIPFVLGSLRKNRIITESVDIQAFYYSEMWSCLISCNFRGKYSELLP